MLKRRFPGRFLPGKCFSPASGRRFLLSHPAQPLPSGLFPPVPHLAHGGGEPAQAEAHQHAHPGQREGGEDVHRGEESVHRLLTFFAHAACIRAAKVVKKSRTRKPRPGNISVRARPRSRSQSSRPPVHVLARPDVRPRGCDARQRKKRHPAHPAFFRKPCIFKPLFVTLHRIKDPRCSRAREKKVNPIY